MRVGVRIVVEEGARPQASTRAISPAVIVAMRVMEALRVRVRKGTGIALG